MKLLKFYTDTCQPCRLMSPVVKAACDQTGLDYEDVNALSDRRALDFEITNVPTLILVDNGKEVARKVGLTPLKDLIEWIRSNGV